MIQVNEKIAKEIISKGESDTVEFKSRFVPDPILSRILTAFANSKGGILFIGIEDDSNIVGLSSKEQSAAMHRIDSLNESIFNRTLQFSSINIENKEIVYCAVDQAPEYIRPIATSSGTVFTRVGTSVQKTVIELKTPKIITTERKIKIFIAMSFGEEVEPALVDYFKALERAIKKISRNIEIIRIDLEEGDYEISQEIMNKIDHSDIVITDFTLNPNNVYFELGYARGKGKRIIQTARKDTMLAFDVRNWRTTFYVNATQLEEKIGPEIVKAIDEM